MSKSKSEIMTTIQIIQQDHKGRALNDSDRRIVRQVSNKAGAATRKARGGTIRINTLQLPEFLVPEEVTRSHASPSSADRRRVTQFGSSKVSACHPGVGDLTQATGAAVSLLNVGCYATPISPPLSPWSNSNAPQHISLLMQPGLSERLLADASCAHANSEPRRWVKICRLSSTLSFLPQLLGKTKALDSAIDCLAEKVRQCLVQLPDINFAKSQLDDCYGRALRALQTALDTRARADWTVWYATLLLTLFELLQNTSGHTYILHAKGAKHLLLSVGADNIHSFHEKTLFAAQAQIMIVEATFQGTGTFLDDPTWQTAMRNAIDYGNRAPERSPAVMTMWAISANAPALFLKATNIVLQRGCPESRTDVEHALFSLLDRYTDWRRTWESILLGKEFDGEDIDEDRSDDDATMTKASPTIYPQYLSYLAMTSRFLLTLQPQHSSTLENTAINAALRIIEFNELREAESVVDMCRAWAVSVARSIKTTTMDWTMQQYHSRPGKTVDPELFIRWNELLGRNV